jgi:hypothetical protein
MPTEQDNESVTRMIDEMFNRGNVDKADESLASDFVEREELPPGMMQQLGAIPKPGQG